jgi:hypothetical protein
VAERCVAAAFAGVLLPLAPPPPHPVMNNSIAKITANEA